VHELVIIETGRIDARFKHEEIKYSIHVNFKFEEFSLRRYYT